ncbi:hypothetical protein P8S54_10145 [Thiomicrospira sp. R3]|nr:hypothetical protein [Thiomicrospira sp. R3]WFE68554.1 hypothetical protein P8S54_10145 [Thiomicrospira sp. R3]
MQNRMIQMIVRRMIMTLISKFFRKATGKKMPGGVRGRGRRPF